MTQNVLLMTRHEKTRLRITPWPTSLLPLPPREPAVRFRFDPEVEAFYADFSESGLAEGRHLGKAFTGETYLKFAALDPQDPAAMEAFLSEYGELGVRGQYTGQPPWQPLLYPDDDEAAELIAAAERAGDRLNRRYADTLLEVRYAIFLMRDLIAAWRALQGDLDPTTHAWEFPLWAFRSRASDDPPWEPDGPAALLHLASAWGLTPFSPYLRTFEPGEDPVPLFAGEAAAWNYCCMELFNHIVEQAEYKFCANEPCNRLFVRQEGRALHGQHRMTGTKYCSSGCARAQAQRAYRRRRQQHVKRK